MGHQLIVLDCGVNTNALLHEPTGTTVLPPVYILRKSQRSTWNFKALSIYTKLTVNQVERNDQK